MKRVFARIGLCLTVTDEEFERLKKNYSYDSPGAKSNMTLNDCLMFCAGGELAVESEGYGESYIPDEEFTDPKEPSVVTWFQIFEDAMGTAGMDLRLKVKDNARAYVTSWAKEKYGIDIESAEVPEDAIEDFLNEHPECDRFNSNGQMLIALKEAKRV